MSNKKSRHFIRSNTPEYTKGYADGMKAAFEESELDAYYAGVGYGKKNAKDKHIGFTNDEERRQFEAGIQNNHKHFRAYRAEPKTFLEKVFGKKESRSDTISTSDKRSKALSKVKHSKPNKHRSSTNKQRKR